MTIPEFARLLLVIILCLALYNSAVWAQQNRLLASFGPCVEQMLNVPPLAVALRTTASDTRPTISVLTGGSPALHYFRLDDSARIRPAGSVSIPGSYQTMVSARLDTTGNAGLLLLSADGGSVTVVRGDGASWKTYAVPPAVSPQRMTVTDINNDGYPDVLLYGRTTAGVGVLLGNAGGDFSQGPVLFPEISVGDLRVVDLNGDGIADVVLLNWLSNQLSMFYGITRAVFSEQVSYSLPGDPGDLAVSPVTPRRTMRIAVTLPSAHQIILLAANATGEIEPEGSIDCPGGPHGVAFAMINTDPWLDVVTCTDRGIAAAVSLSQNEFASATLFAQGNESSTWAIGDLDGDRKQDLVIADRASSKLVVLGNAEHRGRVVWPDRYAVGMSPRGVLVQDLDGDGWADVCVANSGSSTLSLLFNRGDGHLRGQIPVAVPERPEYVTLAEGQGAGDHVIVTAHPGTDRLGVLRVGASLSHLESYEIPTGSRPSIVVARQDSTSGSLTILVRNRSERDGRLSLSLFEQLGAGQFLERSLRLNLPQQLLAITAGHLLRTPTYDLALALYDRTNKLTTIALAKGSPQFAFHEIIPLFSYADSTASTRSILTRDVNQDGRSDLEVVLGPPRNALGIAYAEAASLYNDSLQWVRNIRTMRDNGITFRDVDGDGRTDIIYLDGDRDAVVVLYGMENGGFAPAEMIARANGVTGIAVARLRRTGGEDLIMCEGDRGSIAIVHSAFRRGHR